MKSLDNEQITHVIEKDIEYIQFKRLLEYKDIITHCFTLRVNREDSKEFDFAVMMNNRQNAIENYKTICSYLNLEYNKVIRPIQTHTSNVISLDRNFIDTIDIYPNQLQDVDGLITNKKNLVLSTGYADCTPLYFFDPKKKVIGNVHSGWRGTVAKIGKNAINKMIEVYNCNPKDIIVCIGPTIRECHFEVKDDTKKLFEQSFENDKDVIKNSNHQGIYYINTVNANIKLFLELGILPENIVDSEICTVCNKDRFFSYRANKEAGRMTAIISLI